MLQQKNKKQVFRTPGAAWLFFVLSAFSLFFVFGEAQAITGNYSKPTTGTLAASEWNNLVNDFVAKSGSRLDGNFSINTATSSGYALDIAGILRASHFSGSLSAADVSTGVFGQNTGGGDFNFLGNIGIGIGTSSPNSIITIANNRWISALNSAGTGYVNLFKVNANDELEIGGALNVGQFQFAEDSGFNTFVDMPVSAAPSSGTIEGYTMKVDGDNILTVYSEANGTGGVQNKRIGIGTSTPAFTLDVAGIINASALYVNGAPYIGSQWTTNGTSLYYNTGNVGIGISNPAAKFEVSGGNIFINDALITSGTPKAAITKEYLDSALASSSASIITQVATSSFWQGSLTGNVYNANTGNIGIGTTNPGTKFEIAESSVLRYQIGGGQTTSYISGTGERTVQRVNLKNANANGLGGMWNFYTNYDAAADFFGQFGYKFQGGTTDSFKQFQVYVADIANPKMVVAGSGNVGIGTTDPGAKLHILDTTSNGDNSILKIVANNASGSANLGFLTVGGTGLFQLDYAGNMVFRNPQGGLYFDNQTAANKGIYFRTTTSNLIRMFIGSNGNIGIGTTTPAAALSVSGGNVFINDAAITSGTPKAAITREYLDSSLSAFDTATNLWKANGSNIYASSTGWNVGIGTTNPGTKLTVTGGSVFITGTDNVYFGIDNQAAPRIGFVKKSGYAGMFAHSNNSKFSIGMTDSNTIDPAGFTSLVEQFTLDTNGNIGIGIANPNSRLHLYNSAANAEMDLQSVVGAGNHWALYNNLSDNSFRIWGNNDYLSILRNGNIGVGTTTPAQKLDVVGKIYASGNFKFNDSLYSISVGSSAGDNLTGVTSFGHEANYLNSQTYVNSFGYQAGYNNSGNFSNLIGYQAGKNNTGARLVALGHAAGSGNTGNYSTQIGAYAGGGNTGSYQAVLGAYAGSLNTGNNQSAVGGYAGYQDTGGFTSLLGYESGRGNAGAYLAAVGYQAGKENIGTFSTFIGYNAGYQNSGNYVTSNGLRSAYQNSGINSSGFGYEALRANSGGNVVAIGYQAGKDNTVANQFIIQQANINAIPLIQGNFSTGNVGIGTTNPVSTLDVNGLIKMRSVTVTQPEDVINKSYLDSALASSSASIITQVATSSFWQGSLSGNVYNANAGNVGIGTVGPGAKLDISGTANPVLKVTRVAAGAGIYQGARFVRDLGGAAAASNGIGLYFQATNNAGVIKEGGFLGGGLYNITSGSEIGEIILAPSYAGQDAYQRRDLVLQATGASSGNSNLLIAGNVGIGTTNPGTEKLAVDGGRLSTLNGNNIYSSGQIFSAGTGANYLAGKLGVGQASAGTATLFVNGGTALGSGYSSANIAAGDLAVEGNVGIGTTNPGTQLEIYKTGAPSELRLQRNSGGVFADGDIMGKISNFGNTTSSGSFENANIKFIARSSNGIPITDMSFGVSNYNSGPAEAMRISGSAGNVGIGTTNPAQKLVVGNITAQNTLRINGLSTVDMAPVLSLFRSGSAEWVVAGRSSGLVIGLNPASYADANLLASSKMYFDGVGNVGIGTTNPLNKLDVVAGSSDGASSLNGVRIQTGTGANPQSIQLGANDTGTYSWIQSRQYGIATNNLSLNPHGGNVGIGITNPGAKLDVNGTFKVSGALNSVVLEKLSGTGSRIVMTDASGSLYATSSSVVTGLPSSSTAGQTLRSDGNSWLANSVLYNNGTNVGIGTTNPGSKLSVAGLGLANTPLTLMQAFNTIPYATGNGLGAARIELGHGLLHGYIEAGSSSEMNSGNGYFAFGNRQNTNEINEVMRFNSVGNVGIGTTNPGTEKLAVDGGRLSTLNGNNIYSSGQIFSAGTGANYLAGKLGVGQASAGTATLFVNGGTALGSGYSSANIAAGDLAVEGNVGIGTTVPSAPFHISKANGIYQSAGTNLIIESTNGNPGITFADSGNSTWLLRGQDSANNDLYLWRNTGTGASPSWGSVITFNRSTGNVGIGTTNPGATLDVNGGSGVYGLRVLNNSSGAVGGTESFLAQNTNSAGQAAFIFKADRTGYTSYGGMVYGGSAQATGGILGTANRQDKLFLFADGSSNQGMYVGTLSAQPFVIGTNNAERLRIDSTGNVGIGITNPGAKLDVNGTFKVSGALNSVVLEKLSGTGSRIVMTDASGSLYATSSSVATGLPSSSTAGQTLRSDGNSWLANSVLYNNGTNVGIGTTNPQAKFAIGMNTQSGTSDIIQRWNWLGDVISNWGLRLEQKHTGSSIAYDFIQRIPGSDKNVLTFLNGNVGIGTTNPGTEKLAVDGGRLSTLNGNNIYSSGQIFSAGTGANYLAGKLGVGQASAGTATLFVNGGTALGSGYSSANIAAGNLAVEGNVGIGTTTPENNEGWSRVLDVYGSNHSKIIATTNLIQTGIWSHNSSYYGAPAGGMVGTRTNYPFSLITNGSAKMTILSNGLVGIGTTSPLAKLDVQGTDVGATKAIIVRNSAGTDNFSVSNNGQVNIQGSTNIVPMSGGSAYIQIRNNATGYMTVQGDTSYGLLLNPNGGNVGVGTLSPGAKLDVNGTFKVSGALNSVVLEKLSGTGSRIVMTDASGSLYATSSSVATGLPNASGISGQTLRSDGSNWVANSVLYNNGTNVGIGTTNPGAKLEVNGSIGAAAEAVRVTGGANVLNDGPSLVFNGVSNSNPQGRIYTQLQFLNGATSRGKLILGSYYEGYKDELTLWNGNVGIGTMNPTSLLHVQGNYSGGVDNLIPQMKIVNTATSSSYAFIKVMTGTGYSGGYPEFWMQAGEGNADVRVVSNHDLRFWTNNTVKTTLTKDGNFGVGIANPNSRLHLYNSAANAEMDLQSVVGAGNHWALYNNLSDNSFRIWGNNDYLSILRSGNIGIGNTSPQYNLQIGTTATGTLAIANGGGGPLIISGSATDGVARINNSNSSVGAIQFQSRGNNTVRIDNSGNVGINTTNPGAYRLNVNGNTNISGDLNVSGTTTATNFVGPITGTVSARNVSTGIFGADTGGGDYSFTGNVGIGTTAPNYKLDINGITAVRNVLSVSSITSGNTGADSTTGLLTINTNNSAAFGVWNQAYSTAYLLVKGGNVGIGTTNPGYKLDINAGSSQAGARFTSSGAGSFNDFTSAVGSGRIGFFSQNVIGIAYGSGTTPHLAINSSGNVGIGTTDPGVYRLKVAGDAAITGTLQTQTGSDFAEEFSVSEDLEPGTVVVMAEGGHKSVKAADKAYDPTVVGIVSDNPSIIAGKIDSNKKVVVAMMGVVSVKASDVNGPIKKGDLLTTANISGYAMKAGTLKPGTIIGKALEDLQASSAYIKVLVNLQ